MRGESCIRSLIPSTARDVSTSCKTITNASFPRVTSRGTRCCSSTSNPALATLAVAGARRIVEGRSARAGGCPPNVTLSERVGSASAHVLIGAARTCRVHGTSTTGDARRGMVPPSTLFRSERQS
eukprot:7378644-Prymnesium_polylepis.2